MHAHMHVHNLKLVRSICWMFCEDSTSFGCAISNEYLKKKWRTDKQKYKQMDWWTDWQTNKKLLNLYEDMDNWTFKLYLITKTVKLWIIDVCIVFYIYLVGIRVSKQCILETSGHHKGWSCMKFPQCSHHVSMFYEVLKCSRRF